MTAPQNAWAYPLGRELVDVFRETNFWIIKKQLGTASFDPVTGAVAIQPPTVWHCGAAVVKKRTGPRAEFSKEGFIALATDVVVWCDGITLPVELTTADLAWYQGRLWSLSDIDPILHSDNVLYGQHIQLSTNSAGYSDGNPGTPPPTGAGGAYALISNGGAHRLVESLTWTSLPGGAPGAGARWVTQPSLPAVLTAGVAATGATGSTGGMLAPIAYVTHWQISTGDQSGPWVDIPGATGLNYTPAPADIGKWVRLKVDATDSATPAQTLAGNSAPLQVQAAALVRATLPTIDAGVPPAFEEGKKLTGTPGTASGGTAPISYASHWELSADGTTGWATTPGDGAGHLLLTAAMVGQHVRYVTVATDSTPGAVQSIEIDSAVSPSIAAHASTALKLDTSPVIAGDAVVGAAFSVTTDAVATAGVPPITYTYKWQQSVAALGPWIDIPGATGKTYTAAVSLVGLHLRVVATATDSETTPGPNKLQLPSVSIGPLAGALVVAAAPTLPGGGVQGGVAYGPAVAGTFTGGLAPVVITNRWQSAATAAGPWSDVTGETALTITPAGSLAGQVLRLVSTATDAAGTILDSASAASPAIAAPVITCAGGEVIVRGVTYCAADPGTSPWIYKPNQYDFTYGTVSGWYEPDTRRVIIDWPGTLLNHPTTTPPAGGYEPGNSQTQNPTTPLTYTAPQGSAGDWVERPAGTWHNIRTGQWVEGITWAPDTKGWIIAPSPAAAITTIHAPTPVPGNWVKSGTTGVPTWTEQTTGQQVHQYGDPAVIGIAGAPTVVWIGSGADPWVQDAGLPGTWRCAATGQTWTRGGKAGTRPQPADTATIPRPAVSQPKCDGTANPTYDPWVQLPRVSPVSWWNYVTKVEVQQAAHPAIEQWVECSTNSWRRQTDGLGLVQARRPDLPADTAADWWESPTGTWHSMLRSEIYVQAANPGTAGNIVAITAATPKGVAADWTRSGAGTSADPYVWSSTKWARRVEQPGNPGIAGEIGTVLLNLAITTQPAITGNVQVGQALTLAPGAATGGTAPITSTQQWESAATAAGPWSPITGATGTTYTPVAGDLGLVLHAVVTWTDSGTPTAQTIQATSNATTTVVPAAVPLATGTIAAPVSTLHVGDTVQWQVGTSSGGVAPVAHSAQLQASPDGVTSWAAVGAPITTGTGTYTLVAGDVGKFYRVVDTITDSAPAPATVVDTSTAIGPVVSVFAQPAPPTIAGTATIGSLLTATAGATVGGTAPINPGDFFAGKPPGPTWQWQRASESTAGSGTPGTWVNIAGATGKTHTVVAADAGHFIRVVQTNTDSSSPAKTCTGDSAATALVPAPPATTNVRGVEFGSPDTWHVHFEFDATRTASDKVQVQWINDRTGQVIEQPIDPHTPVPKKSYDPLSGKVDYPAFQFSKPATGWFICGLAPSTSARHTIAPSELSGGTLADLPRTFINVHTTVIGDAYQMAGHSVC